MLERSQLLCNHNPVSRSENLLNFPLWPDEQCLVQFSSTSLNPWYRGTEIRLLLSWDPLTQPRGWVSRLYCTYVKNKTRKYTIPSLNTWTFPTCEESEMALSTQLETASYFSASGVRLLSRYQGTPEDNVQNIGISLIWNSVKVWNKATDELNSKNFTWRVFENTCNSERHF